MADRKYLKYFYTLLQSAVLNSPELHFHVCLVNQKKYSKKVESKSKKIFKNINFFYLEKEFKNIAEKKAFCANYRARFILHIINKGYRNIVYLDVDSLIRKNILDYDWKFMTNDISVLFRNSDDPRFKLLSGVISISGNNASRGFIEDWIEKLDPEILNWFADQVTFYKTYSNAKMKISFGNLKKSVIDWNFDKDSFIWAGKGDRKHKNYKYILETLRIKIKYFISLFG